MRLTIILTLLTGILYATNCDRHPIYCQIKKNNPYLTKKRAMEISNYVYKYTRKHNVDARIYTAILAQESMYSLKAKNCNTGIIMKTDEEITKERMFCRTTVLKGETPIEDISKCREPIKPYKRQKVCFDFGISEINFKTAERYGFDIKRLTEDLDYSIECGVIVLADFAKRYKHREPLDWWTRYNSPTKRNRRIYYDNVKRWL